MVTIILLSRAGKILIDSLLDQMNNNRLSDKVNNTINREFLISQANLMLQGPCNYKKVG